MSLRLPSIRRTIDDDSYNNLSSDKDYSKFYSSLKHPLCSFIFLKGKNKGDICGKKTTDDLALRCSQHKFS